MPSNPRAQGHISPSNFSSHGWYPQAHLPLCCRISTVRPWESYPQAGPNGATRAFPLSWSRIPIPSAPKRPGQFRHQFRHGPHLAGDSGTCGRAGQCRCLPRQSHPHPGSGPGQQSQQHQPDLLRRVDPKRPVCPTGAGGQRYVDHPGGHRFGQLVRVQVGPGDPVGQRDADRRSDLPFRYTAVSDQLG